MNRSRSTIISALVALVVCAVVCSRSGLAHAERRRNPLDDQPAVRHRLLLVKGRFELAPLFESTVNADYRHILGGGAKLEYHLSDMLSLGVIGVYSGNLKTGLVNKIVPGLEDLDPSKLPDPDRVDPNDMTPCGIKCYTREPSKDELTAHLNTMPLHGAAFISVTPWYGKLAAFSTGFVNFDFYFQAGVAFAQLKSDCPETICDDKEPGVGLPDPDGEEGPGVAEPDVDPNDDPPLNDGNRFGLYLGGGIHVFMTEWLALNLTVRDYAFSDNPSGADFDANLKVTDDDSRFLHHLFFGFGVSMMLPPSAKRTR